jgi:hypothetical protein
VNLKRIIPLFLIVCTLLLGAHLPTHAQTQTEASLIAAMEARFPTLMELKLSGKVGETNLALLVPRLPLESGHRRLVTGENSDRITHDSLIAKRLEIPVTAVQWKRTEQIR